MDLTYADVNGKDIGIIPNYSFDCESGSKKADNSFELQTCLNDNVLAQGYFVYIPDTEYGGIIDSYKIDTAKKIVYHKGRTWRAILGSKIIEPNTGEAYYIVSGELNSVLGTLISRLALSESFEVSEENSGISVSNHQFARYVDGYTGIIKMLTKNGAKLQLRYVKGKIRISAVSIMDYSNESELTSDLFDFTIETTVNNVNHVIGLGQGELTDRQVVHRYIDANGNVSDTQYYTGVKEITETYENTNCESLADLITETEDHLADLAVESGLKITAYDLEADIGDKFTARDIVTGVAITQYVTNKIVKINNDKVQISYKVGTII